MPKATAHSTRASRPSRVPPSSVSDYAAQAAQILQCILAGDIDVIGRGPAGRVCLLLDTRAARSIDFAVGMPRVKTQKRTTRPRRTIPPKSARGSTRQS
jgi:hypothetical protein